MLNREEFCNLDISTFADFKSLLRKRDAELFRVDDYCVEHSSELTEKRRNERLVAFCNGFNRNTVQYVTIVDGNGENMLSSRYNRKKGTWMLSKGDHNPPYYNHLSHVSFLQKLREIFDGKTVLYSKTGAQLLDKFHLSLDTAPFCLIDDFLESTFGSNIPQMYLQYYHLRHSKKFPRLLIPQSIILLYRAVLNRYDFELFYKEVLP